MKYHIKIALKVILLISIWYFLTSQTVKREEILQAQKKVSEGRYYEAFSILEKIPEKERNELWYFLFIESIEKISEKEALKYINEYFSRFDEGIYAPELNYKIALIYLKSKNWQNALAHLEKIKDKETYAYNRDFLYNYGVALLNTGSYSKAAEIFYSLMGGESSCSMDLSVIYYYAVCKFHLQQFEVAYYYFKQVEKSPEHKDVPLWILYCLYNMGKYEEVISYGMEHGFIYNGSIAQGTIARIIGESFFKLGRYSEAISFLHYAVNRFSSEVYDSALVYNLRYMLGISYLMIGDIASAKNIFQKMYGDYEEHRADIAYYLGHIAHKENDLQKAKFYYYEALRLSSYPQIKDNAQWNYVILTYKSGNDPFNGAMSTLISYLNEYSKNQRLLDTLRLSQIIDMVYNLGIKTKDYSSLYATLSAFKNINKRIDNLLPVIAYNTALYFFENDLLDSAKKYAHYALSESSDPSILINTYYLMGVIHLRKNNYDSALAVFSKAATLPTSSFHPLYHSIIYNLSYLYYKQGMDSLAIAYATHLDEENPKSPLNEKNLRFLASLYYQNKNFSKALPLYQKLFKISPSEKDLQKIISCYNLMEKSKEKIDFLSLVSDSLPDHLKFKVYYECANEFIKINKYDSALTYFKKALYINAEPDPEFKFSYAITLLKTNQSDTAISLLKKILLDGNTPQSIKEIAAATLKDFYVKSDKYNELEQFVKENNIAIHLPPEDSILYEKYAIALSKGNCHQIIESGENFLSKTKSFNPTSTLDVLYSIANCYLTLSDTLNAKKHYMDIFTKWKKMQISPKKPVLSAAEFLFTYWLNTKDTNSLKTYIKDLFLLSDLPSNFVKYVIIEYMRILYKYGNYQDIIALFNNCQNILSSMENSFSAELTYYTAYSYLQLDSTSNAYILFDKVCDLVQNYFCAGSIYHKALIKYITGDKETAYQVATNLIDNGPSYARWNGKSLILIARILLDKNEKTNAYSLLKSITANNAFPDFIIKEAKELMETIELPSFEDSKEDTSTSSTQ